MASTSDQQKQAAALAALEYVKPGMKLGLGTGSTAKYFVEALAEKVKNGLDVSCVPTSRVTADLAKGLGIKLISLNEAVALDLTVDGADEIDPKLNLIKGGGGALLIEKIVASSSRNVIIIAEEAKRVKTLGKFPLPLEVVPFGYRTTAWKLEHAFNILKLKPKMSLRMGAVGKPFTTDTGHFIFDCAIGEIPDAQRLDALLNTVPGVVDTGLFISTAKIALIGTSKGVVKLEAPKAKA